MATVTRVAQFFDASNSRQRRIGSIAGPASYATGGDAVTPAQFGLGRVEIVLFEDFTDGSVCITGIYNPTTGRLKFFQASGAEIANATNLSTYSARFEAIGI